MEAYKMLSCLILNVFLFFVLVYVCQIDLHNVVKNSLITLSSPFPSFLLSVTRRNTSSIDRTA